MQAHARGGPPHPLPPLPPPPQINTSRGEIAYNVVDISDTEGAKGAEGAEATLAALHGLEGGATRLACIDHTPTMRTPCICRRAVDPAHLHGLGRCGAEPLPGE